VLYIWYVQPPGSHLHNAAKQRIEYAELIQQFDLCKGNSQTNCKYCGDIQRTVEGNEVKGSLQIITYSTT